MSRIERLRPLPSNEVLREMYPEPHDHRKYGRGHGERVDKTIELGLHIPLEKRRVVADLSCGNGVIARAICSDQPQGLHLGDIAGEVALKGENGYVGYLESNLLKIGTVQVYICSETLEHLDNPTNVLSQIRGVSEYLVLSTPLEAWGDTNEEHLWAWDRGAVEDLFYVSGWTPIRFDTVDSREYDEPYLYGIWVAV